MCLEKWKVDSGAEFSDNSHLDMSCVFVDLTGRTKCHNDLN